MGGISCARQPTASLLACVGQKDFVIKHAKARGLRTVANNQVRVVDDFERAISHRSGLVGPLVLLAGPQSFIRRYEIPLVRQLVRLVKGSDMKFNPTTIGEGDRDHI